MSLVEEEGGVRHTDPSTAHEAAASIDAATLRGIILDALDKRPGEWLSYFDLARVTGIPYSSVTPRGRYLMDKKLVEWKIMRGKNAQGVEKDLLHFRAKV